MDTSEKQIKTVQIQASQPIGPLVWTYPCLTPLSLNTEKKNTFEVQMHLPGDKNLHKMSINIRNYNKNQYINLYMWYNMKCYTAVPPPRQLFMLCPNSFCLCSCSEPSDPFSLSIAWLSESLWIVGIPEGYSYVIFLLQCSRRENKTPSSIVARKNKIKAL